MTGCQWRQLDWRWPINCEGMCSFLKVPTRTVVVLETGLRHRVADAIYNGTEPENMSLGQEVSH